MDWVVLTDRFTGIALRPDSDSPTILLTQILAVPGENFCQKFCGHAVGPSESCFFPYGTVVLY